MKHIKITKWVTGILALPFLLSSCETTELDLLDDPNFLTPNQASVDLLLNSIQEDFVRQLEGDADFAADDNFAIGGSVAGDGLFIFGSQLTRMMAMVNTNSQNYASVYQPNEFDDEWSNAYAGLLKDIRIMTPIAEANNQTRHIAIGQFIEAYTLVTMVDFFGDIPYSQALGGDNAESNVNPVFDSGASIYDAALLLLDNAITNFTNQTNTVLLPSLDVFYARDFAKWVKAANTLKMKIYLQRRLVDPNAATSFNAIVASGNYITDSADDFQYRWPATSTSQPDSRHPRYGINYITTGSVDFHSNWLMNLMDTSDDPRIRYYFYRQTNAVPGQEIPPNQQLIRCSVQSAPQHYIDGGFTFCGLPNGYWGRDHGHNDGRDPDGFLVTAWGVYPVGGRFDDNRFSGAVPGSGGGGAGITPILTAAWADFMIAEMAMAANNLPAAKTAMISGVTKSIAKVQTFGVLDGAADLSFEPTASEVTQYINNVSAAWDAASDTGKWNVFGEQFFIAVFGNGVEPYNFYRRTGYPTTLQPNRAPDPGGFPRSMYYPAASVTTNPNAEQKPNQVQPVFWDLNQPLIAN